MVNPSPSRSVRLVDAQAPGRPLVIASLYRDYPAAELDTIEAQWAAARQEAETAGLAAGLTPLEHSHWDWRNKALSVASGHHRLVAIKVGGDVQGVMAVWRSPRPSRLGEGPVVYVDYLEAAPWNLKRFTTAPRYIGVGTVLIAEAVRVSREAGLGGVGLHSLPQAETFYQDRCRMVRVGPDPDYYELTYFEFTDQRAREWLVAIGESL